MRKEIFGKIMEIRFNDSEFSEVLKKELSIYPDSTEEIETTVKIVDEMPFHKCIYNNPRDFFELEDSIIFGVGNTFVRWYKYDKSKVDFMQIKNQQNGLIKALYKFKDIQFDSLPQKSGMLFHELAIVPYIYQLEKYSLIHSSAFAKGNKVFILGGTGGTGKTSLSMKLCRQDDFSFIADDILPITGEKIFPNYAYPKIYAYNTDGSKEIENEILKNESIMSKLQWEFMKKISAVRVRRRVNPVDFYHTQNAKADYLDINYIILARGNFDAVQLEEIDDIDLVSKISLEIIKSELINVNKNLYFHKYNAGIANMECIFDFDRIMEEKLEVYKEFFSNTNNYIMKIPNGISHDEYISKAESIINNL